VAQTPKCDWPATKIDFMTTRYADALPIVDACVASLETQTAAGPPGISMAATSLSYSYLVRAQILALQGSLLSAEASANSADAVARQHGFDNTFLVPWALLRASTDGLILEREGRASDAIATYVRAENYGRAALLTLDLGDIAEARRLLTKGTFPGTDGHVAQGGIAERAGDASTAIREYQAAWAEILQARSAQPPSLPVYFLEASRVRDSLARLGAPVP
jgi:hypothetical protein